MASTALPRALRLSSRLSSRSLSSFSRRAVPRRPVIAPQQPLMTPVSVRGVKTIDFAGTKETVYGKW